MGGLTLKVDDHQVQATFRRLIAAGAGPETTPALSEVLYSGVMDNFEAQGRPTKWKPLSAATLARTGPHAILQLTGVHLRGRITRRSGSKEAEVGVNWVAAAIHQFGGKAGRGRKVTIPARPDFVVTEDMKQELIATMDDKLQGAAGGH